MLSSQSHALRFLREHEQCDESTPVMLLQSHCHSCFIMAFGESSHPAACPLNQIGLGIEQQRDYCACKSNTSALLLPVFLAIAQHFARSNFHRSSQPALSKHEHTAPHSLAARVIHVLQHMPLRHLHSLQYSRRTLEIRSPAPSAAWDLKAFYASRQFLADPRVSSFNLGNAISAEVVIAFAKLFARALTIPGDSQHLLGRQLPP